MAEAAIPGVRIRIGVRPILIGVAVLAAFITMTYCIVFAALRLVVLRGDGARSRKRRLALLGIGLVLVVLVQQTAERGARLVYEYGTGIIGR